MGGGRFKAVLCGILSALSLAGCGAEWFPDNEVTTSSVAISTKSLAAGTAASPYSQTLVGVGGTPPYAWTVTGGGLPAGIGMSGAGVISGTPTTAGWSSFTVQLSDSSATALTATQDLFIDVALPATLGAGQTVTLRSNDTIKVPSGTTIAANGKVNTIVGQNGMYITGPGAVIAVPSDSTGKADNTVIASL